MPPTQSSIDAVNAAYFEAEARAEFAKGNVCWGLYFLDAADFYAEPSPEVVSERIAVLREAMATLTERRTPR
jgi:hypothetical protein